VTLNASLRVVVEELQLNAELEEPFENVEEQLVDSGQNLAATLAALPLHAQMALVVGALHILDRCEATPGSDDGKGGATGPPRDRRLPDLVDAAHGAARGGLT